MSKVDDVINLTLTSVTMQQEAVILKILIDDIVEEIAQKLVDFTPAESTEYFDRILNLIKEKLEDETQKQTS